MRATKKRRFAVDAMVEVALRSPEEPVSVAEISMRRKISPSYLEQLFSKLRRSGLVRSIRGPGGGYVLAREATSINVADIVAAVDEDIDSGLLDPRPAASAGSVRCDTSGLWRDVDLKMLELLGSISLGMLVDGRSAGGGPSRDVSLRRGISAIERGQPPASA